MKRFKFGMYIVPVLLLLFLRAGVFASNIEFFQKKILSGEILGVVIKDREKGLVKVEGEFMGRPINFFKGDNGEFYCMKGISIYTEGGEHSFVLKLHYKNAGEEKISPAVLIKRRTNYKKEEIKVSGEKMTKITDEVLAEENRKIKNTVKTVTDKRMWWKEFLVPVGGVVSSPYGAYRSINKGERKFFHQGVDIACNRGSPVKAANCGEVVLTEKLISRGNTVIINHGQGIFTAYYHLDKIEVKEKDFLKKGALIGLSGSTGMVSGPHLHWSLYAGGIMVDPKDWLNGEIEKFIFGE